MNPDLLERAQANTAKILANVSADQLDAPTPCASWAVRDVVNHVVAGAHWFAITTETGNAPELPDTDYTADAVASYTDGSAKALAAFRAPGALEKPVKLPFGEFPGIAFLGLALIDTFTHGWDLAKATGQDTDIDPELAEQVLALAQASIPDQFRGPDKAAPFGPQASDSDALSSADKVAAFLGRTV